MNGILVESGNNKRFMIYSHNFLHKALMRYMLEVYDCNDREQQTITIKTTKHDSTNTIISGTFECYSIKGAFEVIKVHTA